MASFVSPSPRAPLVCVPRCATERTSGVEVTHWKDVHADLPSLAVYPFLPPIFPSSLPFLLCRVSSPCMAGAVLSGVDEAHLKDVLMLDVLPHCVGLEEAGSTALACLNGMMSEALHGCGPVTMSTLHDSMPF